ncbi:uncharacterized protein Tco025E_08913 [Trypanosoma conorhini]|uniref:Uncharacterized protein n=1 Tax=Trypanosoma conorhini TaxID=83891 RepID=A0A422N336_9TRYP|nr:uncharacterized protein Tco025E_08913 [Trypanosoma conorhini]RNE99888.1 hypothetical protein Tco025E_08913 [Trypanosoma conorhini]
MTSTSSSGFLGLPPPFGVGGPPASALRGPSGKRARRRRKRPTVETRDARRVATPKKKEGVPREARFVSPVARFAPLSGAEAEHSYLTQRQKRGNNSNLGGRMLFFCVSLGVCFGRVPASAFFREAARQNWRLFPYAYLG